MDLTRVRWDNLARLGAVLAVVAVVVLWPRLASEPPAVPTGQARDVVSRAPVAATPKPRPPRVGRVSSLRGTKDRPRPAPRQRQKRVGRISSSTGTKDRPTPADAPPAPAPQPAPAPSMPSAPAIAAAEFGVEP